MEETGRDNKKEPERERTQPTYKNAATKSNKASARAQEGLRARVWMKKKIIIKIKTPTNSSRSRSRSSSGN